MHKSVLCRSEGFTLHGLWPNLDNPCPADYPEHCDNSVFDATEIDQDVLQSMEKLWPSYSTCESPTLHCLKLAASMHMPLTVAAFATSRCQLQIALACRTLSAESLILFPILHASKSGG